VFYFGGMDLPRYSVSEDVLGNFHFYSEGPFGVVHKTVKYRRIHGDLFALVFGDWDELRQLPDDTARTSNNDHRKILMTVAHTVLEFIDRYPKAFIMATGNTKGKTRLYQMAINNNFFAISKLFVVEGFRNGKWEKFIKGYNYDAFLVYRCKNS
jgi:hypothetical protein